MIITGQFKEAAQALARACRRLQIRCKVTEADQFGVSFDLDYGFPYQIATVPRTNKRGLGLLKVTDAFQAFTFHQDHGTRWDPPSVDEVELGDPVVYATQCVGVILEHHSKAKIGLVLEDVGYWRDERSLKKEEEV